MRNLYLLRHAKSSWDEFLLQDFDRPLAVRGIRDASLMGELFQSKNIKLDVVISSPSKRTTETIEHFFGSDKPDVIFEKSLYIASVEDILQQIYDLDVGLKSVMFVGHNPSMHSLTEYLISKHLTKFPTCALANITVKDSWATVKSGCGRLNFFKKPKELR
tara:strand:+ start:9060 stop:9542 length:483 start_codon:yes stop_codon:yes gene_type:complete